MRTFTDLLDRSTAFTLAVRAVANEKASYCRNCLSENGSDGAITESDLGCRNVIDIRSRVAALAGLQKRIQAGQRNTGAEKQNCSQGYAC